VAKVNKFSRGAREGGLGRLVEGILSDRPSGNVDRPNALDFIQTPGVGLGVTLSPVQAIVVKAAYGIPMDYKCKEKVPVWDMHKRELLYVFDDHLQYLDYVVGEGRCNLTDWRDARPDGYRTLDLFVGRRGGKSQVVSAMGTCALRELLLIEDPQKYYGLVEGSGIDFTLIGTDEDSSGTLYEKMRADVNRCPFFTPYLKYNGTDQMTFVSTADRDKRDVIPSISVAAFPCTTRAVRGPSSIFLALDEFAHFKSSKDANSDDLYKAATPATSRFPSKENPDRADSRILLISSPMSKLGKMYEIHKRALEEGTSSQIFTLRCSTVEMYPSIPKEKLDEEYKDNKDTYHAEFGGQFLDGTGSYIPASKIELCIDRGRKNIESFNVDVLGRRFFWFLDAGMLKDAFALAIGHLQMTEGKGIELVYDYIDRMLVGEQFEGPGVDEIPGIVKYVPYTELDLNDVVKWLFHMQQILPCYRGATDQHGGTMLKQLLQINGITNVELIHLTAQINSKMYFTLKGMVDNQSARFPEIPKFISEFKQLEASYASKYVLRVEAPNEKGAHDDMSDAVAGVAMLAYEWLEDEGKLENDPSGSTLRVDPAFQTPQVLVNPGAVKLSDLRVLTRQRDLQHSQFMPPGVEVVTNPFSRRGRR
jgi:hypothetical protein